MQLQIWDILSKSQLQLLGLLCAWDHGMSRLFVFWFWGWFFFCYFFCIEPCILDVAWLSSLDYV